nr:hypothetical protein [Methylobacterium sp. Leaf399]
MKLSHRLSSLIYRPKSHTLQTPLPGFDEVYYRYWYRDTQTYAAGPLAHYLILGWLEGRDPSAGFSTMGYLAANPDVKQTGLNPLIHFLEHGLAEGRLGWQKDPSAPAPVPTHIKRPQKLLAPPATTKRD